MKDERKETEQRLIDSFARWEHLYTHGGSDPFWEDGYNLNLIRNHIIYERRKLEELEYFPEIYNRDIPPEVDNAYMARADEIREHAKQSLAIYLADANYQYLMKNSCRIDKRIADSTCLGNVLGYVSGLREFIKNDSLLEMRRHEKPSNYLESFESCRKSLEKILEEPKPEKPGQLSLFDCGLLL